MKNIYVSLVISLVLSVILRISVFSNAFIYKSLAFFLIAGRKFTLSGEENVVWGISMLQDDKCVAAPGVASQF